MRNSLKYIEKYRVTMKGMYGDEHNGAALIPLRGNYFRVVFSNGGGWDHVSVSLEKRCPTWGEMCYVKELFFSEEELVVQYHPAKSNYVNVHPYCLHLWRPQNEQLPQPPMEYV